MAVGVLTRLDGLSVTVNSMGFLRMRAADLTDREATAAVVGVINDPGSTAFVSWADGVRGQGSGKVV
jgi:hypothetical protein